MMSESADDVTVKGFDNPVFEDDAKAGGGTARLNVPQATNDELAANQAVNGSKKDHEAVNLELVTMTPEKNGGGADIKSKDATIDVAYHDDGENGQHNTHRKMVRGEKYYPGGREGTAKQRWFCWGGILAVILIVIIFIILLSTGVFSGSDDTSSEAAVKGQTQTVANVQPSTEWSQSPTTPAPPEIPIVDSVFSGRLRLDEEFNDALSDKNSAEYIRLKTRVEREMDEAFAPYNWPEGSEFGTVRTQVTGFKPGSVVVDYTILADHRSSMASAEASQMLQRRLQEYMVDGVGGQPPSTLLPASDVTVEPMEDLCAMGQWGCSHTCNFSYTALEFQCQCSPGMVVGVNGKECEFAATEEDHIDHVEAPVLQPALHPDSAYPVDHEWRHEDGETTAEPEPETTHMDHWMFGDHRDHETTPEPEPTTTETSIFDHTSLFGDHLDHETTPEPEPETTPEPEPTTEASHTDHFGLFGDHTHHETTPEPEPETTPEPDSGHDGHHHVLFGEAEAETTPEPEPETTQNTDTFTLFGDLDENTTPEPEPETTAPPTEDKAIVDVALGLDAASPPTYIRSMFNASMRLDEEFPESLHDNTSSDYLKMIVRVKKEMAEAFSRFNWPEGDDLGQIGIKIRKFEPGSIMVYYHITTGDVTAYSAEDVARRLRRRLQEYFTSPDGLLYHGARFPVSEITVEPLRDLCATGEAGCSHKCRYSSVEDTFVCHCPEAMELGFDGKTCQHLHGVPPTVTIWNGQQWVHQDETTPEPEPATTESTHTEHAWMFGDHLDHETTPEPEPETTPEPESTTEPSHTDHLGLFGDHTHHETTPEPEPETTPEPEPTTESSRTDHFRLFGDHSGHETTPEPEPETTPEPDSGHDGHHHVLFGEAEAETTPEPEPESTPSPTEQGALPGGADHEHGETTTPEPQPGAVPTDLAALLAGKLSGITAQPEPAATTESAPASTTEAAETTTAATDGGESRSVLEGEPTTTPEPEPETTPEPQAGAAPEKDASQLSLHEKLSLMNAMGIAPEWESGGAVSTTAEPEPETTTEPAPDAAATERGATEPPAAAVNGIAAVLAQAQSGAEDNSTEVLPPAAGPADTNEVPSDAVNPPSLADDELHHGTRHADAELLPVDNSLDEMRQAKLLEETAAENATEAGQQSTTASPAEAAGGATTPQPGSGEAPATAEPAAAETTTAEPTPEPEPTAAEGTEPTADGVTSAAGAAEATTPAPESAAAEAGGVTTAAPDAADGGAADSTTTEPPQSAGAETEPSGAGQREGETTPRPETIGATTEAGEPGVSTTPEPAATTDGAEAATTEKAPAEGAGPTAVPTAEQTTPGAEQVTTAASEQGSTPASEQAPTTPASEQETTPTSEQETTPASVQETTPASGEATTSASEQVSTPADGQATTLTSEQETTPAPDQSTTPAAEQGTTPTSEQVTTPASDEATTPASEPTTEGGPAVAPTEPTSPPLPAGRDVLDEALKAAAEQSNDLRRR